ELGREAFLKRADTWYEEIGATILQQMKRLGCSCDWSRNRFTMDEAYVRAVFTAFLQYYEKGYIYRGNRIVNWCARCASVVSDLEVIHDERETTLYTLRYPFEDGSGFIEVATTRPETMLGDTAVAVHPEDTRYLDTIGKRVALPLTERIIPIIADTRIDPAFGTGAVKVTPAHDALDAAIGQDHNVPIVNVIGEDGRMTAEAGEFTGLTTEEARRAVVKKLGEAVQKQEQYHHSVALCDRCGGIIEPLISRQWFVDMSKLSSETIEVAKKELIEFIPSRWKEHFLAWMAGVHDWTISRQIWLGHRMPVWWEPGTRGTDHEEGNYIVSLEKPTGEWEQDPDVLDTWFSSALWPFATLGWPDTTRDLARFYPTSTLITGRDILHLWVARMVFSGLDLMQGKEYGSRSQAERIPFAKVFIHPTVLTKTGQRMSK
ncbi:MAG: class I tRNA ligase family protein, partial [Acidobacteriota bacterium]